VVTTAEPSPAEQAVACRALAAALDLHDSLEAPDAGSDVEPTPVAA
jgi:hypothetical protein